MEENKTMTSVEKIKEEMGKNTNNSYIQVVGNFLLQHLEEYPDSSNKILTKDKTIAKSLEAMRAEASKKKVGNCAVLTDQEGFAIVLKYFGIGVENNPTLDPVKDEKTSPPEELEFEFDDLLK